MAGPKDAERPGHEPDPEPTADRPLSPLVEAGWKIESAEDLVFALEELLTTHGLAIATGSRFEEHVLRTIELADQRRPGVASLVRACRLGPAASASRNTAPSRATRESGTISAAFRPRTAYSWRQAQHSRRDSALLDRIPSPRSGCPTS
jgi:hypothetical protein